MSSDYPEKDEFYEEAKQGIERLVEAGSRLASAVENHSQIDYEPSSPLNSSTDLAEKEALREIKAAVPFVSEIWKETQNYIFDMYRNKEILDSSAETEGAQERVEEEIIDLEKMYQPLDRELGRLDRALEEIGLSISTPYEKVVYRCDPGQTTYRMTAD